MTSLDETLRAVLTDRAGALAPASDPLAGIATRARRIRRRRIATAMAGTTLTVSAVAVAVPALTPSRTTVRGQVAHAEAPAQSSPVPANALARGADDRGQLHPLVDANVVAAWADRHPGEGAVYSISLHSGTLQVTPRLHFALMEVWRAGGPAWVVGAQDTAGPNPVITRDEVVAIGAPLVAAVVSGPALTEIIAATSDTVSAYAYDPGDGTLRDPGRIPSPADFSVNLDREPHRSGQDFLVATLRDGQVVRVPVPDPAGPTAYPSRPAGPTAYPSPGGPSPQQTVCCG